MPNLGSLRIVDEIVTESMPAEKEGNSRSLVTTGEKYSWENGISSVSATMDRIQAQMLGFTEKTNFLNEQYSSKDDLPAASGYDVADTVKVVNADGSVVYYTVGQDGYGDKVWNETRRENAAFIPTQNVDTAEAARRPVVFSANRDLLRSGAQTGEINLNTLSSDERVPSSKLVAQLLSSAGVPDPISADNAIFNNSSVLSSLKVPAGRVEFGKDNTISGNGLVYGINNVIGKDSQDWTPTTVMGIGNSAAGTFVSFTEGMYNVNNGSHGAAALGYQLINQGNMETVVGRWNCPAIKPLGDYFGAADSDPTMFSVGSGKGGTVVGYGTFDEIKAAYLAETGEQLVVSPQTDILSGVYVYPVWNSVNAVSAYYYNDGTTEKGDRSFLGFVDLKAAEWLAEKIDFHVLDKYNDIPKYHLCVRKMSFEVDTDGDAKTPKDFDGANVRVPRVQLTADWQSGYYLALGDDNYYFMKPDPAARYVVLTGLSKYRGRTLCFSALNFSDSMYAMLGGWFKPGIDADISAITDVVGSDDRLYRGYNVKRAIIPTSTDGNRDRFNTTRISINGKEDMLLLCYRVDDQVGVEPDIYIEEHYSSNNIVYGKNVFLYGDSISNNDAYPRFGNGSKEIGINWKDYLVLRGKAKAIYRSGGSGTTLTLRHICQVKEITGVTDSSMTAGTESSTQYRAKTSLFDLIYQRDSACMQNIAKSDVAVIYAGVNDIWHSNSMLEISFDPDIAPEDLKKASNNAVYWTSGMSRLGDMQHLELSSYMGDLNGRGWTADVFADKVARSGSATVYQALNYICKFFAEEKPGMPVIFVTPLDCPIKNAGGNPQRQYGKFSYDQFTQAVNDVATMYGHRVVNLVARSGLNSVVPEVNEKYFSYNVFRNGSYELVRSDSIHPGYYGHKAIADAVLGAIENEAWDNQPIADSTVQYRSRRVNQTTLLQDGISIFNHTRNITYNDGLAVGQQCQATGQYSIATGFGNNATASYAVSHGRSNTASGEAAFASGGGCEATHKWSAALGAFSKTTNENQVITGRYNKLVDTGNSAAIPQQYAFAVGNGTNQSNRSTGFAVLDTGWIELPIIGAGNKSTKNASEQYAYVCCVDDGSGGVQLSAVSQADYKTLVGLS